MLTGWLIVAATCLALLLGAPLFTALGIVTLGCVQFLGDGFLVEVIADMFNTVNKDMLLAIPFFVAAGQIMTEGTIARRLRIAVEDVPRAISQERSAPVRVARMTSLTDVPCSSRILR